MVDAVPSAILYLDRQHQFLRANRRGREMIGSHPALADLQSAEPWASARRLLDLVVASGVDDFMETSDPSTHIRWDIAVSQLRPNQTDTDFVLVIRDITDRSRLEARLRRRDQMATLGQLVYGISHKIRSNLFGITGLIDVLRAEIGGDPEIASYLDLQRQQSNLTVSLLDGLMQYAGPQDFHRTPGHLKPVVINAIDEARKRADTSARISVQLQDDLPELLLDRDQLATALAHILQNALESSPRDGCVEVRGHLVTETASPFVELTIDDSGPGLADDDLSEAFEPFFSRRPRGQGMGLPIARRIVRDHLGTLALDNRPEKGCRATVRLPVTSSSQGAEDTP